MRKSKFALHFLILLIIAVMAACRKDEPLPCNKTEEFCCENFPDEWADAYITWFSESRFQYKAPYFNPNNPNEFVYWFRDRELGIRQVIKYNMLTQQKIVLVDNFKLEGQPKWSRKGWIALPRASGYVDHIFVVKDNGDSLLQFTTHTANHYPVWNSSGEKLYWAHSPVLGVPYFFLVQNLYGGSVDTLLRNGDNNGGYSGNNDISINNQLVSQTLIGNTPHLATADLNSSTLDFNSAVNLQKEFNYDFPSNSGLCWSADGHSIYFTILGGSKRGLFSINLITGKKKQIKCFCDTKRYEALSCSSDGKYLIAERVDSQLENDTTGNFTGRIIWSSFICLIDLKTLAETKLNLE